MNVMHFNCFLVKMWANCPWSRNKTSGKIKYCSEQHESLKFNKVAWKCKCQNSLLSCSSLEKIKSERTAVCLSLLLGKGLWLREFQSWVLPLTLPGLFWLYQWLMPKSHWPGQAWTPALDMAVLPSHRPSVGKELCCSKTRMPAPWEWHQRIPYKWSMLPIRDYSIIWSKSTGNSSWQHRHSL